MIADFSPTGVVFDCDGLLVDTEQYWHEAEASMCRLRGLDFTADDRAALLGTSLQVESAYFASRFGEPAEAVGAELVETVAALVGAHAQALPGAVCFVAEAGRRVPLAVASNSPRRLVDLALSRGGFDGAFELIVAADNVAHPKPHPQPYATACTGIGREPARVVAFEDSPTGLASARGAGLFTVGIPSEHGLVLDADAVFASFAEPELATWPTRWV